MLKEQQAISVTPTKIKVVEREVKKDDFIFEIRQDGKWKIVEEVKTIKKDQFFRYRDEIFQAESDAFYSTADACYGVYSCNAMYLMIERANA